MRLLIFALVVALPTPMLAQKSSDSLDLSPTNSLLTPKTQLERQDYVETEERIVTINGVDFQQIRYGTDTFYIQMNTPDSAAACTFHDQTEKMYAVKAAAKVTRRARVFVESLRQRCDRKTGSIVTETNPYDTNIGVELKDREGSGKESLRYNPFLNRGSYKTSF